MAASTDFGVTDGDVIDELPVTTAQIDATSEIVNTAHIDVWIDEAAGVVCAILAGRGMTPATIDADGDVEKVCIRAIKAFAAAKALRKMNAARPLADQLWNEYTSALDILRQTQVDLGDEKTTVVSSNINTASPSSTTWRNRNGTDSEIW